MSITTSREANSQLRLVFLAALVIMIAAACGDRAIIIRGIVVTLPTAAGSESTIERMPIRDADDIPSVPNAQPLEGVVVKIAAFLDKRETGETAAAPPPQDKC